MADEIQKQQSTQGQTTTQTETSSKEQRIEQDYMCQCHDPAKKLFLRNDLGMADDIHPIYAICLLSAPKGIHKWDGSKYVLDNGLVLIEGKKIVDSSGKVVAEVGKKEKVKEVSDVMKLEDDEKPSQETQTPIPQEEETKRTRRRKDRGGPGPQRGDRVNLDQDEFYLN